MNENEAENISFYQRVEDDVRTQNVGGTIDFEDIQTEKASQDKKIIKLPKTA